MNTVPRPSCPGELMLSNALQADAKGKFEIAYQFYKRGIAYYLEVRLVNEVNSSIKEIIKQTCQQHLSRAETLKQFLESRNDGYDLLNKADRAYRSLEYDVAYPLYTEGIEKMLFSISQIEKSHPNVSQSLLSEVAKHLIHAEEVKEVLKDVSSSEFPEDIEELSQDDVEESKQIEHDNVGRGEPQADTVHSKSEDEVVVEVNAEHRKSEVKLERLQDANDGCHTKEEKRVRVLLYRERVESLKSQSHLLIDYLKVDAKNEDKISEMERVIRQITDILDEKDESGGYIIGIHSTDRENLELSLQCCNDILSAPHPSSLDDESSLQNDTKEESLSIPECLLCFEEKADMATFPCGHRIMCHNCFSNIEDAKFEKCYICNTKLKYPKCIRIYD